MSDRKQMFQVGDYVEAYDGNIGTIVYAFEDKSVNQKFLVRSVGDFEPNTYYESELVLYNKTRFQVGDTVHNINTGKMGTITYRIIEGAGKNKYVVKYSSVEVVENEFDLLANPAKYWYILATSTQSRYLSDILFWYDSAFTSLNEAKKTLERLQKEFPEINYIIAETVSMA